MTIKLPAIWSQVSLPSNKLQASTSLYPRNPEDEKTFMTGKATSLVFVAGQILMFGCIGLLQIAPGRFFVPLLLAMHAGILLFMKTKRSLPDNHRLEVARITRATYALMAMYLPILLYKLSGRLGLLQLHDPILHGATLVLSVLAALLVVCSSLTIRACVDR